MAGAGYKLFNTGDVLTAAQVNTYLMEQTVMVFADAAARTAALSGVVSEGMISYLKDTNAVEVYDGSNWVASDDPNAIQNTIVDAKGDLISASAADTPARLAVGNNGETLVADSSATTGLRWQGNYSAGKNKILNSDFGIWQRGTSVTISADNTYYAPDRFLSYYAAGGSTQTWSRQAFTAGTAPVAGYEGTFFNRISATSGGASTELGCSQRVEDVRVFAGQTATFSFWAKTDTARTVTVFIQQNFGSGGSASVTVNNTTISATTSWARYSVTVSVPSISGKTIGTNSFLNVGVYLVAGNATGSPALDTWGWQLEAGSVATPFTTATGTLAGELAACQRYYQKSYNQGDAPATATTNGVIWNWVGTAGTGTLGTSVKLPVIMRTTPTLTIYDGAGNSGKVFRGAANKNAGTQTGSDGTITIFTTDATSTLEWYFHFVASAEL